MEKSCGIVDSIVLNISILSPSPIATAHTCETDVNSLLINSQTFSIGSAYLWVIAKILSKSAAVIISEALGIEPSDGISTPKKSDKTSNVFKFIIYPFEIMSAARRAIACIVGVGFTAPDVANTDPSITYKFSTS